MNTLQPVFAAVSAKLPTGTKSLLGPEHLKGHSAPPRVVWVPDEDLYTGASQVSAPERTVLLCRAGVGIHCWGAQADYSDAEELRRQVILALDATLSPGSYRVAKGAWLDADKATWLKAGRAYRLELALLVPIVTDPDPTATVTRVAVGPTPTR